MSTVVNFGKYKGYKLSEVPDDDYLHWYVETLKKDLRIYQDEIDRREALKEASMPWAEKIIRTGYRVLTKEHHPDKGGNNADMQAINGSHEVLLELLKRSNLN
jgi:hypothetical protein